ncbi:MAG: ECF transporter S component [Ruminococcus sp.]|nr:ECF transporter S component [Ruminococcus sp.]
MKKFDTKSLVLMGMLTALLIVFAFTPIGSIPVGGLSITLSIIPIAIGAIALGPAGGAAMGAVFGLLSFLQCIPIGMPSGMGIATFEISPVLTFVQRFIPRVLDGLLVGFIYRATAKKINAGTACFVGGFFSAFLNTIFFLSALFLLFGSSDYAQSLRGGKGILAYIGFILVRNSILEIIASTVISGAVGSALIKAGLIEAPENN